MEFCRGGDLLPVYINTVLGEKIVEKENVLQKLMGFLNKAGTAVMMNLMFLVSCLPIVTIGAAWSGLYGAVRYSIRGDSWFAGFKYGYKCHFFRNLIGWIFGVLVGGYALSKVYVGVANIIANPAILSAGVIIPLVISGLFALAALLVVAVMLPLGMYFPQLDANTWLVTTWEIIAHAPLQSLVVVALMWFPAALAFFNFFYFYAAGLIFLAVYFVLATFIATILLKKSLLRILKRYPREEEE